MKFDYTFDVKKLKLSKEVEAAFMEKQVHENFATLFENFLKSVFPQLSGAKLRCMTRILNKLDIAVAKEVSEIELDESEKKFLKDVFTSDEVDVRQEFMRIYLAYSEKFSE